MANLTEIAEKELDSAQIELQEASIAAIEAKARESAAETAVFRLKAAVAALSGEPPPAAIPQKAEVAVEKYEAIPPKKEVKPTPDNPLAHIKCTGCGQKGSMAEQYIQSTSGSPVRTLTCSKCGNQAF
jgi:DNA-directed RNA polymerase subunit M/transcription elongation factor TFIIS